MCEVRVGNRNPHKVPEAARGQTYPATLPAMRQRPSPGQQSLSMRPSPPDLNRERRPDAVDARPESRAISQGISNGVEMLWLDCGWVDADLLACSVFVFKGYNSINQGEKSIISTHSDILARVKLGPQLSHQDVAGQYRLPSKTLNTPSLACTVPTISGASSCFLMCHFSCLQRNRLETAGNCFYQLSDAVVPAFSMLSTSTAVKY
jgi:hypothetical protein